MAGVSLDEALPPPPTALRQRWQALHARQEILRQRQQQARKDRDAVSAFLQKAPQVAQRLDALSQHLFGDILAEVERNLTYALQEVLEQNLKVVTTTEFQRGGRPGGRHPHRPGRLSLQYHLGGPAAHCPLSVAGTGTSAVPDPG